MTDNATSLDRLHDIVSPAPVPWWPPAAGWYILLTLVLGGLAAVALRGVMRWRGNAYRRAALRELAATQSASAMSELLRRTALATTAREHVAAVSGAQWPDWLAARFSQPMPDRVRAQLTVGVYGPPDSDDDVVELREYAARWIKGHRPPQSSKPQQVLD